jgi:hypothetical protein
MLHPAFFHYQRRSLRKAYFLHGGAELFAKRAMLKIREKSGENCAEFSSVPGGAFFRLLPGTA